MSEIYTNSDVSVENVTVDTKECPGGVCPVDYDEEPADYMRDSTILGSETSYNASGEESLSGSVELGATEQVEATTEVGDADESHFDSMGMSTRNKPIVLSGEPSECSGQCEGCPCQEPEAHPSPELEDDEDEDEEGMDEEEDGAGIMYVVMEDDMPVFVSNSLDTATTQMNSMISDTVIKHMPTYNVFTSMGDDGIVTLHGTSKSIIYRWCSRYLASFKIVETPYI